MIGASIILEIVLTFIHPCYRDIVELLQYTIQFLMVTPLAGVQYWNYQKTSDLMHMALCYFKLLSRHDCGAVLLQKECRISPTVTTKLLSSQLADLGVEMVRIDVIIMFTVWLLIL